ncbi:MAG: DUF5714 domain-containing protein [Paraclostridium sp.]|uniref:DUF5714 domain-containing protein n=1 Tax=Paraclostridium sp. TaxID=2023273 RepID=UPI003F3FCF4B
MNKFNCLICGEEIIYLKESEEMECYFCKTKHQSGTMCKNNHYVCDTCHSIDAYTIITDYCIKSNSINPLEIAMDLMKHPSVKMHGPEHHYLVPAVLITAYLNKRGNQENLKGFLKESQKRAENVLGGFCGFYGACGAGIGCGIYISIIQQASPLSKESWGLCNLMTSKALENISSYGGPRCCKRDSFIAIESAIDFTKEHLNIDLDKINNLKCEFNNLNEQCLNNKCKFYKKHVFVI